MDECLPCRLKNPFAAHESLTGPEALLAGKKKGELLTIAEQQGFEIFLTMDKGIEYEQNLASRRIAVVLLRANSNRPADILPLGAGCLAQIASTKLGQVLKVE